MSFVFPSWPTAFSPEFHESAKAMLEGALNKGNKPPVIQGRIEVVELSMGKEPPTLTLLEIGDLSLDRFRGILRLGYSGDAWLEVRCRVQANPLSHNPHLAPSSTLPLSTPLLARQPLLVPMTLRLSKIHLRAILILVVSASKGITLVFKNDPLQNVDVSSTFDSVEVIRGYLQQEIEGQLREMFREDLPGIIHRLSQQWFTGTGVGGKVELPYRDGMGGEPISAGLGTPGRDDSRNNSMGDDDGDVDQSNPFVDKPLFPPHVPSSGSSLSISTNPSLLTPRRRASMAANPHSATARLRRSSNAASESPTSYTVFPDIEDYDPTYGLRPEGVPTHSGYEAYGRLWEKAREGGGRGLGSLMSLGKVEEDGGDVSDNDWDEAEGNDSLDMVELEESLRPIAPLSRSSSIRGGGGVGGRMTEEDQVEWETFPAVGGGTITRPRVYHIQSQIRAPSEAGGAMPSPSGTGGSVTARASSVGGASSTVGSLRITPIPHMTNITAVQSSHPRQSNPGPSSLRRMVTSRSDVFLSSYAPRPSSVAAIPTSKSYKSFHPHPHYQQQYQPQPSNLGERSSLPRRQSHTATAVSSSAARTSGSSWDRDTDRPPTRSNTLSSNPTSHIPSSKSLTNIPNSSHLQSSKTGIQMHHQRSTSIALSTYSPQNSFPPRNIGPGGITLPLNNSVSQLATLSHSAHTLSPYARAHEHIAVRSFPHLGSKSSTTSPLTSTMGLPNNLQAGVDGGAIKARRKRIYHLGKKGSTSDHITEPATPQISPGLGLYDAPGAGIGEYRGGGRGGSSSSGFGTGSASLTGLASKVMGRPNMVRSPESRTSYGFPESR